MPAQNGMTALMAAAIKGHAECAEILLEKGADKGIVVSKQKAIDLVCIFPDADKSKKAEIEALLRGP